MWGLEKEPLQAPYGPKSFLLDSRGDLQLPGAKLILLILERKFAHLFPVKRQLLIGRITHPGRAETLFQGTTTRTKSTSYKTISVIVQFN